MAPSLLSVPLTLGLLHPLDVVRAGEDAHRAGAMPIASAEGFVRQVLGWREYVRQLYWRFGRSYLRRNALRAADAAARLAARARRRRGDRPVSAHRAGRGPGLDPPHQRLMVLGNHALQRGYRPAELSDWFREAFVDGFEWVMPPTVIGMSHHADGGLLATKASSAGGRTSRACPTTAASARSIPATPRRQRLPVHGGYWAWTHRHREMLAANHRTARAVARMDRLADLDAVVEQESAGEPF